MGCQAQSTKHQNLVIRDCGLAAYRGVLALQQELHARRRAGQIGDTVLLVEHPEVITLGARRSANRLLVSEQELAGRGVDLVTIRRAGGTTAHNPGQLVVYPILHLQERGLGVSEYIRQLEAIGAELLEHLGVQVERRKGYPGLWVSEHQTHDKKRVTSHESRAPRKIGSVGVRVSRLVTYHGMAINVQNDLRIFDFMVPCGLDGVQMTSVQNETGRTHDMKEVKAQLAHLLMHYFGERPR